MLFDRAYGYAKFRGNFPVLHSIEPVHEKYVACSWRQMFQAFLYPIKPLPSDQPFILNGLTAAVRHCPGKLPGRIQSGLRLPVIVYRKIADGSHEKCFRISNFHGGSSFRKPEKSALKIVFCLGFISGHSRHPCN